MDSFLVIGADKGIGFALSDAISGRESPLVRTTRNPRKKGLFLDLSELPDNFDFDEKFSCAFLCAARSGFHDCDQYPLDTFQVNVEGTLTVAKALLEAGCFVIFLSSSAVFDGSKQWPDEFEKCSPTTEYGRQKALAEKLLLEMDGEKGNVAIVRLTKVLTSRTPVIRKMLDRMHNRKSVEAFSDLKISPISMEYVVSALLTVASKRVGGIYHLSGDDEMSYAELARRMAAMIGADPKTVRESDSSRATIHFRPTFPGLGMRRTRDILGLQSDTSEDVLKRILSGFE